MQTEVSRASLIGSTIKQKNPLPTRLPKQMKSKKKITGTKKDGRYSNKGVGSKEYVGKRGEVVEGEIVEEPNKPVSAPEPEIWDAEEVRPALEGKKPYARPMPRQLQGPHVYANAPENRITEIPTKSVEGKRTRISTARLAGNRLSWDEVQSGKYAGSMPKGSTINKTEGIKVGQRPSTRAQKDPQYKQELLAKLEGEVNGKKA